MGCCFSMFLSPIVCVEPRISSISSANVSKTVIFTRIQTSSSPSSSCLLARGIECSVSCSMLWGRILLCVQWIWEGSNFEKQNEMNICVFQSKTLPKQLKLYWVSLESTELNTIELWIFTTSWSHVHWTIPGSKQPSLLNRWTVPAPWGGFPQLKRFGSPNVPQGCWIFTWVLTMMFPCISSANQVHQGALTQVVEMSCFLKIFAAISLFFFDFSAQSFTGPAPF